MTQKIHHDGDYKKERKKRYPPQEDFIDAYYHLTVNNDDTHMKSYIEKVKKVKSDVPKTNQEV